VIDRSTVCPVRISGVPGQAITFNLMNSFGEAAAPGRLLAALQAGLRHPDQLRLRAPPRLMASQNSHFAWHAPPLPSQPSGLGPPTGGLENFLSNTSSGSEGDPRWLLERTTTRIACYLPHWTRNNGQRSRRRRRWANLGRFGMERLWLLYQRASAVDRGCTAIRVALSAGAGPAVAQKPSRLSGCGGGVGDLSNCILTWLRRRQRPFRRKRHSPACFDRVDLTGHKHREVARMTNAASEVASLIAGPPVDIRTRRADDRRAGILRDHQPTKAYASFHAGERQAGLDEKRRA
jgi:hypothetical protein